MADEKFWIIGLFFQNDGITFRLYSDPYKGVRYYGDLKFPFKKGSPPPPDEALAKISEVLAVSGAPPAQAADNGDTQPKTPLPAIPPPVPLRLPATYVNAQTPTDQLQLNADDSFSLQASGQTSRGTFAVDGSTLEIKIDGDTTPMAIKGNNLTDPSGQIWTLREQPGPTVPGETALRNEDILKLVKVGIDDATIIAKIGSSKCQFDTSPNALVQLKESGVSAAVLKAMVGPVISPPGTLTATGGDEASTLSTATTPSAPSRAGLADASVNPAASGPLIQPSVGPTLVTGRVVWNGMPVPNVRVELKQDNTLPALASAVSGADGTFTIQQPPPGSLMIYGMAPNTEFWAWAGYPTTVTADHPTNFGDLVIHKKLQLLSPANQLGPTGARVAATSPTLQWNAFPGAARYDVYVFNNTTRQRVFLQSTPGTQVTVSPALQSGQQYQWSVDAYNSSRQEIAYYSAWYFTVQ